MHVDDIGLKSIHDLRAGFMQLGNAFQSSLVEQMLKGKAVHGDALKLQRLDLHAMFPIRDDLQDVAAVS
jgi:hypothetical protein